MFFWVQRKRPWRTAQDLRGQDSLLSGLSCDRTRGRPRGLRVEVSPRRFAVDAVQRESPKRVPRWTERRMASSSLSERGSLTRATQLGERRIGQGDSSGGSGSAGCCQRQRELQRQFSARVVRRARRALRST